MQSKKPKRIIRALRKSAGRNTIVNIKVTDYENEMISLLADKYAAGNRSAWIRFATLNFKPQKHQLVPYDETDESSPYVIPDVSETPPYVAP